jgi:hypothetical protein
VHKHEVMCPCVQGCFTGVQTQEVLMSLGLKYVLVVLASGTTQQQLMDMQCDTRQLESLANKKDVLAVCVTCSGVAAYMTHCKFLAAFCCDMSCFLQQGSVSYCVFLL